MCARAGGGYEASTETLEHHCAVCNWSKRAWQSRKRRHGRVSCDDVIVPAIGSLNAIILRELLVFSRFKVTSIRFDKVVKTQFAFLGGLGALNGYTAIRFVVMAVVGDFLPL